MSRFYIVPAPDGFHIIDEATGQAVAHRNAYTLARRYVEQANAEESE